MRPISFSDLSEATVQSSITHYLISSQYSNDKNDVICDYLIATNFLYSENLHYFGRILLVYSCNSTKLK